MIIHRTTTKLPRPGEENDTLTPACYLCGQPHVGMLVEAHVLLPGSFAMNPETGEQLFVLDPEVQVDFLQMPNGQLCFRTPYQKPGQRERICAAAHTDCVERVVEELFDDADDDDGEIEEVDYEEYNR